MPAPPLGSDPAIVRTMDGILSQNTSPPPGLLILACSVAARYDELSPQGLQVLPNNITKLFPLVLLACNAGAAICCAVAGDYRRSLYWAAFALCVAAITF